MGVKQSKNGASAVVRAVALTACLLPACALAAGFSTPATPQDSNLAALLGGSNAGHATPATAGANGGGGQTQPNYDAGPSGGPAPSPVSIPAASLMRVHVEGVKKPLTLTPDEYLFVKEKKDAIEQYLYQQQQLDQLRKMLHQKTKSKAVSSAIEHKFPLTPAEIKKIRRLHLQIEKAQNAPITNPKINIKTVNLDVNSPKPLVVHVAEGYASSLVFFDDTGAPWPIEPPGVIGNKNAFGTHIVSADQNVAVFDIKKRFKESNALINLKGLAMPIVLQLDGDGKQVDSRVAVRLPMNGPKAARGPVSYSSAPSVSGKVMDMLNGDYPSGAIRYKIKGAPATAMLLGDWLYIRSQAQLLSPPPQDVVTSPTGYKVYKISPTANLLFSFGGGIHEASVGKAFTVGIKHTSSVFSNR